MWDFVKISIVKKLLTSQDSLVINCLAILFISFAIGIMIGSLISYGLLQGLSK